MRGVPLTWFINPGMIGVYLIEMVTRFVSGMAEDWQSGNWSWDSKIGVLWQSIFLSNIIWKYTKNIYVVKLKDCTLQAVATGSSCHFCMLLQSTRCLLFRSGTWLAANPLISIKNIFNVQMLDVPMPYFLVPKWRFQRRLWDEQCSSSNLGPRKQAPSTSLALRCVFAGGTCRWWCAWRVNWSGRCSIRRDFGSLDIRSIYF